MSGSDNKTEKTVIWTAFVLLSAVFVSLVWNNNVWMDEAFTASLVHTDFAHVISRSMADTLPPLYNIILKIMTSVFGYKLYVMKLTSEELPLIAKLSEQIKMLSGKIGFEDVDMEPAVLSGESQIPPTGLQQTAK